MIDGAKFVEHDWLFLFNLEYGNTFLLCFIFRYWAWDSPSFVIKKRNDTFTCVCDLLQLLFEHSVFLHDSLIEFV